MLPRFLTGNREARATFSVYSATNRYNRIMVRAAWIIGFVVVVAARVNVNGLSPSEVPLTAANVSITFVGTNPMTKQSGRFATVSGALALDATAVERSFVEITIDMRSVETADDQLTGHLKSADFFDVARFPAARFVSTRIERPTAPAGLYRVRGMLELKNVRHEIEFPMSVEVTPTRITASGDIQVNRRTFNVAYNGFMDKFIRDEVFVSLRIDAERPPQK